MCIEDYIIDLKRAIKIHFYEESGGEMDEVKLLKMKGKWTYEE